MLVGTTITSDDEAVLDEFLARWREVNWTVCASEPALIELLLEQNLEPIAIEVSRIAVPYYTFKLRGTGIPAFIVGSEDEGIPDSLLAQIRPHVYIPMAGTATCYSVGMALAIVASHFAYVAAHEANTD